MPLVTQGQMWLQHDGLPLHFGWEVMDYWTKIIKENWLAHSATCL